MMRMKVVVRRRPLAFADGVSFRRKSVAGGGRSNLSGVFFWIKMTRSREEPISLTFSLEGLTCSSMYAT